MAVAAPPRASSTRSANSQDALTIVAAGRGQSKVSRLSQDLKGVRPRDRSAAQHIAMGLHMRAAKAAKRQQQNTEQHNQRMVALAETLQHAALRVSAKLVVKSGAQKSGPMSLMIRSCSGAQGSLSAHAWMRICFSDMVSPDRAVARSLSVSGKTVRTAIALMCGVVMRLTESLYQRCLFSARAASRVGHRLDFCSYVLSWDETSRVLCFPLKGLGQNQSRSNWHVCVSAACLDLVWERHADQEVVQKRGSYLCQKEPVLSN